MKHQEVQPTFDIKNLEWSKWEYLANLDTAFFLLPEVKLSSIVVSKMEKVRWKGAEFSKAVSKHLLAEFRW